MLVGNPSPNILSQILTIVESAGYRRALPVLVLGLLLDINKVWVIFNIEQMKSLACCSSATASIYLLVTCFHLARVTPPISRLRFITVGDT